MAIDQLGSRGSVVACQASDLLDGHAVCRHQGDEGVTQVPWCPACAEPGRFGDLAELASDVCCIQGVFRWPKRRPGRDPATGPRPPVGPQPAVLVPAHTPADMHVLAADQDRRPRRARTKVLCRCCLLAARAAIRVYASAWLRCRPRHDSSSGLLIRRYRMGWPQITTGILTSRCGTATAVGNGDRSPVGAGPKCPAPGRPAGGKVGHAQAPCRSRWPGLPPRDPRCDWPAERCQ